MRSQLLAELARNTESAWREHKPYRTAPHGGRAEVASDSRSAVLLWAFLQQLSVESPVAVTKATYHVR
jgi:hypothetical protein